MCHPYCSVVAKSQSLRQLGDCSPPFTAQVLRSRGGRADRPTPPTFSLKVSLESGRVRGRAGAAVGRVQATHFEGAGAAAARCGGGGCPDSVRRGSLRSFVRQARQRQRCRTRPRRRWVLVMVPPACPRSRLLRSLTGIVSRIGRFPGISIMSGSN